MDPYSLSEIQVRLADINRQVSDYFAGIAAADFFQHPAEVWSPAENLAHLSISVRPVTLALRVPRRVSGLIWGAPGRSRPFSELVAAYQAALAQGGQAPAQFVAQVDGHPGDPQAAQARLLADWRKDAARLEAAAAGWQDEDLDKAAVPHPLLGKLTLRELLFFTLYHNLHHINDVRTMFGEPPLEG